MSDLRKATAERLYDCNCDCKPRPPAPMPDGMMPLSVFEDLLYKTATYAGYVGSKTDFRKDLSDSLNGASQIPGLVIQKDSIDDFPSIGLENAVYIDTEESQIYYWKEDGYYKIYTGAGEMIPSDGLTYDGGVI